MKSKSESSVLRTKDKLHVREQSSERERGGVVRHRVTIGAAARDAAPQALRVDVKVSYTLRMSESSKKGTGGVRARATSGVNRPRGAPSSSLLPQKGGTSYEAHYGSQWRGHTADIGLDTCVLGPHHNRLDQPGLDEICSRGWRTQTAVV